jgi:hypothetical protein
MFKKRWVYSWLKVFRQKALVKRAYYYDDLEFYLQNDFKVAGSFHSYNRSALHHKIVLLEGIFKVLQYNPICKTITVGAGVKVHEIMEELSKHGRRLINSGNFFKQTYVGAAINGTHGFGKNASIADQIIRIGGFQRIGIYPERFENCSWDDVQSMDLMSITAVTLNTAPEQSFKVTSCVCTLSEIDQHVEPLKASYREHNEDVVISSAYAVLPYSDKEDPVTLVAFYEDNNEVDVGDVPQKRKRVRPWHWWRVKLWWMIDGWFPPLRRYVQRAISFLKLKPFVVYTHPKDFDALYDPDPGLTGQTGGIKFSRWAYRPTYTCYNIALFVKPEDIEQVLRFSIDESERIKKTLLRCFIGCRVMCDKSDVWFTGNAHGPMVAVDWYCTPKNAKYLIQLQQAIQKKFNVRPHLGKTVLRGE